MLGFTVVLIPLGFETVAFLWWALPAARAMQVSLGLAIGLSLTLAVPWSFRRTGSTTLGAHLVLAAGYALVTLSIAALGGVQGSLMHWLCILPLVAGLMGSRSTVVQWMLVCTATFCGFVLSDHLDLHLRVGSVLALDGPALWIQRSVDVGSWLIVLLAAGLLYEGHTRQQTSQLVATNRELASEVEQRREAEQQTYYLAHYDELTNLPNRRLFNQLLNRAKDSARRAGRSLAVLFLDLDGFKEINDTYGHAEGDILLKEVAHRLQTSLRLCDSVTRGREKNTESVSRLGGDEFTILLEGLRDHHEAATVARRILAALRVPIQLSEAQVPISASIGIALQSESLDSMYGLLRRADLAMYYAKQHGKNDFHFFEESMNADIQRRQELARDLPSALATRQFVLAFQPIVEATTNRVVCVEALVRWKHPEHGIIYPDDFIGIAEANNQMGDIGEWILQEACQRFREWQDAQIAPMRIAVNVSAVQLRKGRLADSVKKALETSGLAAKHLELEITETAVMADEEEAAGCLAVVKDLGVRLALDDFGTGYSSLSYLNRFPVDSLKIDRSFVHDLVATPDAQAIARAMISLAHEIGLTVVAEGVETASQRSFLVRHGCDELQGFLFSKPLDEKELRVLLEQGHIEPDLEPESPATH